MKTWITPGYTKNNTKAEAPASAGTSYKLYMAKNESESCVISLRSDKAVKCLTLSADSALKVEFLKEYPVPIRDTDWPDPIVPVSGSFDLEANVTLNILVRFTTDEGTKSGDYATVVTLSENGCEVCKYDIAVRVWNITYPVTPSCETAIGLTREHIAKIHKVDPESEKAYELYKNYFDTMLSYKINPAYLPYDILDPRADAYMDDPRITCFQLDHTKDNETLKAYYAKLCTKEEWLKKSYFYPFDEPITHEHMETIKAQAARLDEVCPIHRCVPFYKNTQYNDDLDEVQFLSQYIDIFCPKSYCWKDSNIYSAYQTANYPSFYDRMKAFKEAGNRIWWYVCWEPGDPYCNMYVDEVGINHRVLFWQQYMYGAEGFLYWAASWWLRTDDPWTDMATVKDLSLDVFGDGSLLYNGNKVGIDGAVASIRTEVIRDGIEDFELLKIASKVLGEEWVIDKIHKVTTDLTTHSKDSDLFDSVRIEIGEALSAELSK